MKVPHVILKERPRHVVTINEKLTKQHPTMVQIHGTATANLMVPPRILSPKGLIHLEHGVEQ